MQYNGFMTCKDLAFRVQDSTGPRGSLDPMSGLVLETKEELFFNDIDFLITYLNASATKQSDMPGHAYYTKVLKFIEKHFQVGELYMEYIKNDCSKDGATWDFCTEYPFRGPYFPRVPRPYPGDNGYFLPYASTTLVTSVGSPRPVDDKQPRLELKKLFHANQISSKAKKGN